MGFRNSRVVSSVIIDATCSIDKPLCVCCEDEINLSTSHYGRFVSGWSGSTEYTTNYRVRGGEIVTFLTHAEKRFPVKIAGEFCDSCYERLYAITWRDSSGHLRRAFEGLIRPVIQPVNDDFEHTTITKGLYAPHAAAGSAKSAYINETDIKQEKLVGFGREENRGRITKTRKLRQGVSD